MDAEELAWWQVYEEFDPFGGERGDIQAGTVAAAAVNLFAKEGEAVHPLDLMPDWGQLRGEMEKRKKKVDVEAWAAWLDSRKGR